METGGLSRIGRSVRLWRRTARFLKVRHQSGFTILEVLIVLAVTAALFVSAVVMIVGRQNRTAFEQAVRDIQSQIQGAINEVAIGHYPNKGPFNCAATPTGPKLTIGAAEQGTKGDCIFIGKILQFGVPTDPEQFKMYTIAGLRLDPATGNEAKDRIGAHPRLIAPRSSDLAIPDQTTTSILTNGLTTLYVRYGAGGTAVGGVAIWQLAPTVGGALTTDALAVQIGPAIGTTLGMGQQQFVDNANLTAGPLDDPAGIKICFVSGGSNQSGLVTIGGNGRPLSVTLNVKSSKTCV